MHAELNVAGIARARVEAVAPLEPGLALRTRLARLAAHRRALEHGAGGLGRLDPHPPIAVAVGFLVGDEGVVAVQDGIIRVNIAEGFVTVVGVARRSFDQLFGRVHGCGLLNFWRLNGGTKTALSRTPSYLFFSPRGIGWLTRSRTAHGSWVAPFHSRK